MDDAPLDGLSSLVRLSGHSVPARARFVGEALITSTLSSLTLGLSCGMLGSACFSGGPLIPFFVGSWTGYTFGLVNHWRTGLIRLNKYANQYPTILAHALMIERGIVVPRNVVRASEERLLKLDNNDDDDNGSDDFDENNHSEKTVVATTSTTLEEWIHQGGLGRVTWSVLAAQSCVPDVEDLQRQQRQKLMEEHQEKYRCE